jgi:hypothetical protein
MATFWRNLLQNFCLHILVHRTTLAGVVILSVLFDSPPPLKFLGALFLAEFLDFLLTSNFSLAY